MPSTCNCRKYLQLKEATTTKKKRLQLKPYGVVKIYTVIKLLDYYIHFV